MQKNFLIFLLILISQSPKAADFDMNSTMQKAYSEIIKTNLDMGRTILENDKTNNGVKVYLKSYADLIQLLINEEKDFYEQFIGNQTNRITYLEKLDKKSPYNRFLQAEIRIHTAFVKLKFGHEVKGSWEIIKAYKLLEANVKEFPDFVPNQKIGRAHV